VKLTRRKQLYLDEELEKQVTELAQREERSLDGQLRRLIRIGLEHALRNEGKAALRQSRRQKVA